MNIFDERYLQIHENQIEILLNDIECGKSFVKELMKSPLYEEDILYRIITDTTASTHYEIVSNYEKATSMIRDNINRAIAYEMWPVVSFNYNILGIIYYSINLFDKAMDSYMHAIHLEDKYGFIHVKDGVYSNIGEVYATLNDIRCIEYQKKSYLFFKNNEKAIRRYHLKFPRVLANMVMYLCKFGKCEDVPVYYDELLEMEKSVKDKFGKVAIADAKLSYYIAKKDGKKAYQYFVEALDLYEDIGHNEKLLSTILSYLHACEKNNGIFPSCLDQLYRVNQIKESMFPDRMFEIAEILVRYYRSIGDTENTLKYIDALLKYSELKEKKEREQYLNFIEIVLNNLNKENENSIIREQNKRLNAMTEELKNKQKALELYSDKLKVMANVDGLTKVHNRRYFKTLYEKMIVNAEKKGHRINVFMFDIDYFKRYNDTYGHLKGDDCLKMIASTLSAFFESDTSIFARYGGEEFIGVTMGMDCEEAAKLADESRLAVRHLNLANENTEEKYVTISVGGLCVKNTHVLSSSKYIHLADNNLYSAKKKGRNRVVFAEFGGEDGI